jgi:hypothetical protein
MGLRSGVGDLLFLVPCSCIVCVLCVVWGLVKRFARFIAVIGGGTDGKARQGVTRRDKAREVGDLCSRSFSVGDDLGLFLGI